MRVTLVHVTAFEISKRFNNEVSDLVNNNPARLRGQRRIQPMEFPRPLVAARFLRREKRFLVHVRLEDGSITVAHTNNTGRMSGCLAPGARVWLSPADDPRRKLKWTLEIVETVTDEASGRSGGVLVGVNTILANRLAAEALSGGIIPGLARYTQVRAEVPYGSRGSRADFLLTGGPDRPCWVEVKNVTLVRGDRALFPDAPSERGRKHLLELAEMVTRGDRAALVFCVQRYDARVVGPADDIDPRYGEILRQVAAAGVEVHGLRCQVDTQAIRVVDSLPQDML
jgi:sugar fermentation stimulation protein A